MSQVGRDVGNPHFPEGKLRLVAGIHDGGSPYSFQPTAVAGLISAGGNRFAVPLGTPLGPPGDPTTGWALTPSGSAGAETVVALDGSGRDWLVSLPEWNTGLTYSQVAALPATTSNPWAAPDNPLALFTLANRSSKKVLDVTGGPSAVTPGTALQQWTGLNGTNQQWQLVFADTGHTQLIAWNSGLALDGTGGRLTVAESSTADTAQHWLPVATGAGDGSLVIYNRACGLCLEVVAGSLVNGAAVSLGVYTGAPAQQWLPTAAVTAPLNATAMAEPVLASPFSGQATAAQATFRNTGTSPWLPTDVTPAVPSFTGAGVVTVVAPPPSPNAVAPGEQATFSATVVLPNMPTASVTSTMGRAGSDFGTSGLRTAALSAAGASQVSATLVSTNAPESIATGNGATFTVSVTNTGTLAWWTQASHFAVGVDAASQTAWNPTIDPLPAVVAPGKTVPLTVSITGGPAAGQFDLNLQVTHFGTAFASERYSPEVPTLLAAKLVGMPKLDSPFSGQLTTVEATFLNTGNTAWSPVDPNGPYLPFFSGASWTPLATITPAGTLTTDVKPGDSYTYSATVVLPTHYCVLLSTAMKADRTAVAAGGPYMVCLSAASKEQVNATLVANPPTEVAEGADASFSLTVTNTGTFPWHTGPGLYTVSLDSTSAAVWAPSIGPLPAVVEPGAVVTVPVTITGSATYESPDLTFQAMQGGAVFATSPSYTVSIPRPPKDRDKIKDGDKTKDGDKNVVGLGEKPLESHMSPPGGDIGGTDALPEGAAQAFIGSDERPRVGSTLYDQVDDDSADSSDTAP